MDLSTRRLFWIWDKNEEHDGGLMNFKDGQMVGSPLVTEHEKGRLRIWVGQDNKTGIEG